MISKADSILMIGASGMGMAPLALYLKGAGHAIMAYDDYPSSVIKNRLLNAEINWVESLLDCEIPQLIILSRALGNAEFIEYLEARFPGVEIIFRGDFLARIANEHKAIAITGSHGKTTTTGLLIHALNKMEFPISYILGGFFDQDSLPAAQFRDSEYLLIEVDESDRTIDAFSPWITVITNLDLDHTGYYQNLRDLRKTFRGLLERTKYRSILSSTTLKELQAEDQQPITNASIQEATGIDFKKQNELLAQTVISEIDPSLANEDFHDFAGIERRQSKQVLANGEIVIEDYAHHPVELKALIEWLRCNYKSNQLKVVFQPHRYTRTASLMGEFVEVLRDLDLILIPEYGAFESKQLGASSRALYDHLEQGGSKSVAYCEMPDLLEETLLKDSSGSRIVAFVGAGDINHWFHYYCRFETDSTKEENLISYLCDQLSDASKCLLNEQLGKKTTLNVGGNARYYVEPANLEDLQFTLKTAKRFKLKVAIIGKGSNTLVSDEGFDGILIRLSQKYWRTIKRIDNEHIWVAGGASLKEISKKAESWELAGFEFYEGIPGAIGGAVAMNAGAMKAETADLIESLDCLDFEGNRLRLSRDELSFQYRKCPSISKLIVISATLKSSKLDAISIQDLKTGNTHYRKSTQPWEPSAGCMFKNPSNNSAGRLIDMAGLKGYRIGDAEISAKHANFLVNTGKAKSADVEAVIAHAKAVVYERFGVELESEIRRLGG